MYSKIRDELIPVKIDSSGMVKKETGKVIREELLTHM